MNKRRTLPTDIEKAIHARAALLFCVVCEAEGNGASPDVIRRHLREQIEAMEAALSEIDPPERVRAIVDELINAYNAHGGPVML
jgi:hypothetical protein